ncbi:tRNA lysidine(34) synthetase TilS [Parvularcula marina]|uniref:tRNA lysidine(34) synthetase TilS n=1 Tax=Parvularcula marina TaxID=2292771 RepID=UPI0013142ED1|nr:tRNA lysidine(34) synthetase TilS [Parvularcula marina]
MAVAVSGGADSFALLHVLHEKNVPIIALTVDHGLRPEAAYEAAKVAEWCAARGISHETLVWTSAAHPRESGGLPQRHEVPDRAAPVRDERSKGNLQANARTARYRLLCDACNRLGLETLVTAHTADDQAETVFMRLRRGSGQGLAGMPETRLIAGGAGEPVTLYRPLLGVRRTETQSYAEAHDLPVSYDPSNEDDRFERVRIRALLAALEQQDLLTVEALCRTAEEAAELNRIEAARNVEASQIYMRKSHVDASVQFLESFSSNSGFQDGAVIEAVHAVSGSSTMPTRYGDLFHNDAGQIETVGRRYSVSTISGVILAYGLHDAFIFREPAALLGRAGGAGGFEPIAVKAGEKHLYDRRFIVHVPEGIAEVTVIKPLGALIPRDIATSTLDRKRISTLPCLTRGDALSHIPAACQDFIAAALSGWKQAEAFLDNVGTFKADSLLEERFSGRVIRF